MRFFSNKIYVNGASKNFNDIISEVAGGMNKQASVAADANEKPIIKQAKEAISPKQESNLPAKLVKAIKNKEQKQKNSKKKSSVDGKDVKIASIVSAGNDSVEIEFVPSESKYAEIEIEEDGNVKTAKWGGAMSSEAGKDSESSDEQHDKGHDENKSGEADGEDNGDSEACESCGMSSMASSSDFVKVANLTDKQKSAFRNYWQNIWPSEFIDAVLDKDQ